MMIVCPYPQSARVLSAPPPRRRRGQERGSRVNLVAGSCGAVRVGGRQPQCDKLPIDV